jgi:hypothetical protein
MTDANRLVGSPFALNAYNSENNRPVTQFTNPMSIEVGYDDSMLGNRDESRLGLFSWNNAGGQWDSVPNSEVQPEQNMVQAPLTHLTTFAVRVGVQAEQELYLPVLRK